jgi:hypothetical protein
MREGNSGMKPVPRYITSVMIQNNVKDLGVSLGYEKNGTMRMYFQDPAELGLDSTYINERSFPNSGLIEYGKYSMWTSMFTRHFKKTVIEDEE